MHSIKYTPFERPVEICETIFCEITSLNTIKIPTKYAFVVEIMRHLKLSFIFNSISIWNHFDESTDFYIF